MELKTARNFVNRTQELGIVADLLGEPKAEPTAIETMAKDCLANFYGVPGIGKTALLAQIYTLYRHHLTLLTIVIDLRTLSEQSIALKANSDLHRAKIHFIRTVAQSIQTKKLVRNTSTLRQLKNLSANSDDQAIDQAMATIVAMLSGLNKLVMLLLDSWEYAPEAMLAWVERLLLLPLIRSERIFCFLGSQVALRWRQFEVRRRVQAHELHPLGVSDTSAQIGCGEELQNLVFELTAGLPLANEIVHEYLERNPATAEWLTEHREVIARNIIAETQERVVTGMPEEIKPIFRILSLFREFDVNTLQIILPQFLDMSGRSQSALLQAIKQLLATRLVNWNDTLRAYQIDPTIRKIFARALAWEKPELHTSIHAAALAYYEDLVREVPSNRHVYICEYFYHLLYIDHADSYNDDTLKAQFESMIRRYYISPDESYADTAALAQLRGLIENDEELKQALVMRQFSETLLCEALDEATASVGSAS